MNALFYARVAQSAYSEPPDIGQEARSARAIKTVTSDGLTVAFPGTNNAECLLTDIDALTIKVVGLGELHRGFWEAYGEIATPLMTLSPKVVVGHSEGAALALIYAGQLCLAGKPPAFVYAFEPPRLTMDDILALLLDAHDVQALLTRNGNDVITQVPSWMRQTERLTPIGTAAFPFDNVTDHLIENVIKALSP